MTVDANTLISFIPRLSGDELCRVQNLIPNGIQSSILRPEVNRIEQIQVKLSQVKINEKKQSFWQQHKVKILTAVALLSIFSIASIKLYNNMGWIDIDGERCSGPNLSDEFNSYMCAKGEWKRSLYNPPPGFCERARACSLKEKIIGCVEGKYFHHLSKECLKNPQGFACKKNRSYEYPSKACIYYNFHMNIFFKNDID